MKQGTRGQVDKGTSLRGNQSDGFSRVRLGRSLLKPVNDWVPVFGLWFVERRVVGVGGENEKLGAAVGAGEEFFSHVALEKAVAVALDNEDGQGAVA